MVSQIPYRKDRTRTKHVKKPRPVWYEASLVASYQTSPIFKCAWQQLKKELPLNTSKSYDIVLVGGPLVVSSTSNPQMIYRPGLTTAERAFGKRRLFATSEPENG